MINWFSSAHSDIRSFVFLDRDGVINIDRVDYVKRWEEFQFHSDSLQALYRLQEKNIGVIVISNQSALHRGYMTWDHFWQIHHGMVSVIRGAGGDLLGAFYCPHRPDEGCGCRKPYPGLITAAAEVYGISLEATYMIGDRLTDMAAAARAGCSGVLIDRCGGEAGSSEDRDHVMPDRCYSSLLEAVTTLF